MFIFYLCFLAGGFVIPLISVIAGFISDGADTDVSTDIDVDVDIDMDMDADLSADASFDSEMDVHTDMSTDVSGDGILTIGFLPTSLMAISALAIMFGAVGAIMSYTGKGKVITFILSLVVGYVASVVIQTIVKTLKKVQTRNYGISERELLLYDGKVVDTILPGQLGTVSFTTLKNVSVSFPARCEDSSLRLPSGKIVKPTDLKDGIVIVKPKNKYE